LAVNDGGRPVVLNGASDPTAVEVEEAPPRPIVFELMAKLLLAMAEAGAEEPKAWDRSRTSRPGRGVARIGAPKGR